MIGLRGTRALLDQTLVFPQLVFHALNLMGREREEERREGGGRVGLRGGKGGGVHSASHTYLLVKALDAPINLPSRLACA